MKILISTPLYPPENHYPANFSKDLAHNLQKNGHDVVLATFANFPEHIDSVKIVHVDKNRNIFIRMFLFLYQMIRNVGYQEIVVLKQAGFSSFLTALVAWLFRIKIILKMREDEVEVRINNQKVAKNSFTIWRVRNLQKIIFYLSDQIIFDSLDLQQKICREYKIKLDKTKVLKHPVKNDLLPFENDLAEKRKMALAEWEKYVSEFEQLIKKYE